MIRNAEDESHSIDVLTRMLSRLDLVDVGVDPDMSPLRERVNEYWMYVSLQRVFEVGCEE